jgi:hypothetical protein
MAMAQSAPGPIPTSLKSCTSTCTPSLPLSCTQNTIANFNNRQYVPGTGTGQNSVGAVWYFYDISTDNSVPANPVQVNASITIDAAYQATVVDFDDNSAVDQNGNPLPNLFAPTISADQILSNASRTGYVQFTIRFYKNTVTGSGNEFITANYLQPILLSGLNYVHYDIDGISGSNYELRETGLVKQITATNPAINVNANSELNSYIYSGDGSTWRGFVGSTCNRTNTSNCSEVVAAMSFTGAYQAVTIRMGYNYNRISGNGLNSQPGRLYASTFGCFNFPQQSQLPIKLISFSGNYRNQTATLSWETESELNFDHFEIERSVDGINYSNIASKPAKGNTFSQSQYQYSDDLSSFGETAFFYRLKMIDIDGKFSYSNTVLIRKEQKVITGISISPDPVISGNTFSARFTSTDNSIVYCKIIDLTGKTIFLQQNKVSQGNNSIPVNVPAYLQAGMYVLQISNETIVETTKFTIVR